MEVSKIMPSNTLNKTVLPLNKLIHMLPRPNYNARLRVVLSRSANTLIFHKEVAQIYSMP